MSKAYVYICIYMKIFIISYAHLYTNGLCMHAYMCVCQSPVVYSTNHAKSHLAKFCQIIGFRKYPAKPGFCQIYDKFLPDERFCQMICSSGEILPDESFLPHVATVCQIGWSGHKKYIFFLLAKYVYVDVSVCVRMLLIYIYIYMQCCAVRSTAVSLSLPR